MPRKKIQQEGSPDLDAFLEEIGYGPDVQRFSPSEKVKVLHELHLIERGEDLIRARIQKLMREASLSASNWEAILFKRGQLYEAINQIKAQKQAHDLWVEQQAKKTVIASESPVMSKYGTAEEMIAMENAAEELSRTIDKPVVEVPEDIK